MPRINYAKDGKTYRAKLDGTKTELTTEVLDLLDGFPTNTTTVEFASGEYVLIELPAPITLKRLSYKITSAEAIKLALAVSTDSTTGFDGKWTVVSSDIPAGGATLSGTYANFTFSAVVTKWVKIYR